MEAAVFEKQNIQETVNELKSDAVKGLTDGEAFRRLQQNGRNEMKAARKKTKIQLFLEQLKDPLIYILLIAAVVSIVVKEWMFWYTRGAAKKINSGALMADAWHHRSDALSSIGAFVGIFGARLGYPILDPIASIVICFMIAKASIDIFRDAIDKMVDHSCDAKTEEFMKREILKVPGVRRVDLLKTRLFGSKMYVDIEIAADGNISLCDAHDIAENVHHTIENKFKDVKHCMVHVNPING